MLKAMILVGLTAASVSSAKAGHFVFTKIDVPGNVYSFVNAINASNIVVGGFQLNEPGLPLHGFVWANGTTSLVTVPGETNQNSFVLVGVNKRGVAVGSFTDRNTGAQESYIYDLSTGDAKPITPPAGYLLNAMAMSDTNIVVGSAVPVPVSIPVSPPQNVIFTKTFGKPVTLLGTAYPSGDKMDYTSAVASSGEIVGVSIIQPETPQAFSYLNGSFASLAPPAGGSALEPIFVNNRGLIAGFYQAGAIGPNRTMFPHGFVQRGSHLQTVDFPAPAGLRVIGTTIAGVTRTGDVLGSYTVTDANHADATHGFIRHQGIWTSFDVPGSIRTSVAKINEQGSIAGTFTDVEKGVDHAFVGVCTADQAPCTQ